MSIMKKINPLILLVLSWFVFIILRVIIVFLVFDFGRSQLANKIFLIAPILTICVCIFIGKIFNEIEQYRKIKWKPMLVLAGIVGILRFVVFFQDQWIRMFQNIIVGIFNFYLIFLPFLNILFIFLGYKMFRNIGKTNESS